MHPRIQQYITFTAGHLDMLKVIEERVTPSLSEDKVASQVIAIIKLQTAVLKAQMQTIPKTDGFIYSEEEMINELQKLNHLLEEWEIAEKATQEQELAAFLDLAEQIGPVIIEVQVPLQLKIDEKRKNNNLTYPPIHELLQIKTQIKMIDPLIQKLSSDAFGYYYGVAACLKAFQIGTLEVINKRIELTETINALLMTPSKIKPLFEKYQELVEKEEKDVAQAEQRAALDTFVSDVKAIRTEGQSLPVIDSLFNAAANSALMSIQAPSFYMPSISDSPQSLSVKAPNAPPSSDDEGSLSRLSLSSSGNLESKNSQESPTTPRRSISASSASTAPQAVMFKSAEVYARQSPPVATATATQGSSPVTPTQRA